MVTQKLTIRLDQKELPEIRMVSGDVGREIQIEVYAREDSDTPIDLETYSAEITIIKPDNTFIMDNFDGDEYELPEQAGAVSGFGYYQIKIFTSGSRQIYTGQGPFLVDDMILSDDVIESSSIAFGDRFPEDFATKTWVDNEIEAAGIGTYVAGNPAGEETMPPLVRLQINDDIYPLIHKVEEQEDADITNPSEGDVLTYDADDQKWKNEPLVIPDPTVTKTATGNPIEFTDGADAPLVKCVTQITGYQEGTGTPSPDNVRPIVAYTEGEIEVRDGDGNTTTHTTTYPSAIYRGSEDVVNGSVTAEFLLADMGDFTYVPISDSGGRFYTDTLKGTIKNVNYTSEVTSAKCSCYESTTGYNTSQKTIDGSLGLDGLGRIYFYNSTMDGKTDAQIKTALTGQQLAYELVTPQASSVTPTNLPIKSLSGYNHIESSTGDMEVEYITQQYEPLQHLHYYSTAEQVVGKWVDGSNVKEKTYIYTGTGAANPFTTTIDFTGKSIIEVIPHYVKYTYGGGTVGYCAGSALVNNNSNLLNVAYDVNTPPTVSVTSYIGSSTDTYEVAFTIRYI